MNARQPWQGLSGLEKIASRTRFYPKDPPKNTLPIFFIRSFYLNPVRTCQNLAHTHKAQAPVRELRVAHVASPHELPNNIFGPLKLDHRCWKETLTTLAIL
jgi:hypothetical protein